MWWMRVPLFACAVVIPAAVALAVLPQTRIRDTRHDGFPWFWLSFPITCLASAYAIGGTLPSGFAGSRRFAPYEASEYSGIDAFTAANITQVVMIVVAIAAGGTSIWAWITKRR